MENINISFSMEELKSINAMSEFLSHDHQPLSATLSTFMNQLKEHIYFDKSDFMFFHYNKETQMYEMQSFFPINWTKDEINDYAKTYMHLDDVLPILSTPHQIAFRNKDIFSIQERKKTKYYREFVQSAQLEISIDANVPLSSKFENTFAILGLFRDSDKNDFSMKELELIKMFQHYLSNTLNQHLEKENAEALDSVFSAFDNFESLGVCIFDSDFKVLSYNTTLKKYAIKNGDGLLESAIIRRLQEMCIHTAKQIPSFKMSPISFSCGADTYLLEICKYGENQKRFMGTVYSISDFFIARLSYLKSTYKLSNREYEVVFLMLKNGFTIDQIAIALFISPATVKRHLYTAYQKMGISNQKQLLSLLQIL